MQNNQKNQPAYPAQDAAPQRTQIPKSSPASRSPQAARSQAPSRSGNGARPSANRPSYNSSNARPTQRRSGAHNPSNSSRPSYAQSSLQPAPKKPQLGMGAILVGVGVLVALAVGVFFFLQNIPVGVTFNGAALDVGGQKTIAEAMKTSGFNPKPGNLVAVDGSVLEEGKGEPFHATLNGKAVSSLETKLGSGDVVEVGDGGPIEEAADVVEEAIPWDSTVEGNGAIHVIEGSGQDGKKQVKTGKQSGKTAEQVVQEPSSVVRRNLTPDTGNDKVIALTFDDGPWKGHTADVLDVLAEHGAKATFFTVGDRIESGNGKELVKRAASEGHQICTHSYDHALGSGQSVNLGYMTPEEQIAEIEKGYAAIEAATGSPASRVIRTPGGNYGPEVTRNIASLVTAEIGWNVDSGDWRKPGAGAIAEQIESAWPGAIVLLHDGGGDRSQTVEALKIALPQLKEQGYRFITIDELMKYPLK